MFQERLDVSDPIPAYGVGSYWEPRYTRIYTILIQQNTIFIHIAMKITTLKCS